MRGHERGPVSRGGWDDIQRMDTWLELIEKEKALGRGIFHRAAELTGAGGAGQGDCAMCAGNRKILEARG